MRQGGAAGGQLLLCLRFVCFCFVLVCLFFLFFLFFCVSNLVVVVDL